MDAAGTDNMGTSEGNSHTGLDGDIQIEVDGLLAIAAAIDFHSASGYDEGKFCFCHNVVGGLSYKGILS